MTQENQPVPDQQTQPQAAAPEQATPPLDAPQAPVEGAAPTDAAQAPGQQRQQRGRGGQRGGGQRGGGRGRGRRDDRAPDEGGVESAVVRIYRCSKVVKGGRTFSFGALVVAGDRRGNVGIGYGKANEVPPAVEKATKDARKQMIRVNLKGTTIPHVVKGTSGASTV